MLRVEEDWPVAYRALVDGIVLRVFGPLVVHAEGADHVTTVEYHGIMNILKTDRTNVHPGIVIISIE